MRRGIIGTLMANRKVIVLLAVFAAAVMLNAAYYYTKTRPAGQEIDDIQARLDLADRQVEKIDEGIERYENFAESRAHLEEFKALLPTRSEYPALLRDMYELGNRRKVLEKSFGANSKSVGDLEMITFTYPVSGSYRDVREFVHDVETSDLFLNINNLSLSSAGKGGGIKLNIGLSTYVRN